MSGQQANTEAMSATDAAAFISSISESVPHTSFGADWSGLQAIITEQGDIDADVVGPIDFLFLEVCLSGFASGYNRIDDLLGSEKAEYRPQALFFVPPGGGPEIALQGKAKNLQLMIERRVLDDVAGSLTDGASEKLRLRAFNSQFDPQLLQLALQVADELRTPGAGGAMIADSLAQAIVVHLLRKANAESGWITDRRINQTLSKAQISQAIDYMESNLEESVGLAEVAEAVGASTYTLAKGFKTAVGEAPHQYLMNRRIEKARTLLEKTSTSLAEIAFDCGFSSQQHLTSVFSKRVGVSPGKYRRELH